jgi:nucleotide-binding universal stress UspA family protein
VLRAAAEEEADVLLVGAGELGATDRRLARALVRKATCSVWFVPPNVPPKIRRIVVPIDFTTRAADSLRVATAIASLSGAAECLTLHVYFNESLCPAAEHDALLRQGLAQRYGKFAAVIDNLGVKVLPLFREGARAARVINRTVGEEGADLIVMASRGRSWLGGLLRASLAGEVLQECCVPLLVVKHFGARLGWLNLLRERLNDGNSGVRFN